MNHPKATTLAKGLEALKRYIDYRLEVQQLSRFCKVSLYTDLEVKIKSAEDEIQKAVNELKYDN